MDYVVDAAISTTESVMYDAIYIPEGKKSIDRICKVPKYIKFINEAFKHCKAIAVDNEGKKLLDKTFVVDYKDDAAVFVNAKASKFKDTIAKHRN